MSELFRTRGRKTHEDLVTEREIFPQNNICERFDAHAPSAQLAVTYGGRQVSADVVDTLSQAIAQGPHDIERAGPQRRIVHLFATDVAIRGPRTAPVAPWRR